MNSLQIELNQNLHLNMGVPFVYILASGPTKRSYPQLSSGPTAYFRTQMFSLCIWTSVGMSLDFFIHDSHPKKSYQDAAFRLSPSQKVFLRIVMLLLKSTCVLLPSYTAKFIKRKLKYVSFHTFLKFKIMAKIPLLRLLSIAIFTM